MSDIREVYDMVTKQKPPEPGALERQQRRQVRTSRNRKAGVFALASALGIVAIVLIVANRPESATTIPADVPATVNPADAPARDVAMGFLGGFGAFDAGEAMMYVAHDADLSGVIESQVPPNAQGLALMLSWLKASGYSQAVTSCDPTTLDADTRVFCRIDWNGFRSDEIGRGPYSGDFTFTVRDGEIVSAAMNWDLESFSPQMWEPFATWVSKHYPDDAAEMYTDGNLTNFRLTPKSVRLWEQHTKGYVEAVDQGTAT